MASQPAHVSTSVSSVAAQLNRLEFLLLGTQSMLAMVLALHYPLTPTTASVSGPGVLDQAANNNDAVPVSPSVSKLRRQRAARTRRKLYNRHSHSQGVADPQLEQEQSQDIVLKLHLPELRTRCATQTLLQAREQLEKDVQFKLENEVNALIDP